MHCFAELPDRRLAGAKELSWEPLSIAMGEKAGTAPAALAASEQGDAGLLALAAASKCASSHLLQRRVEPLGNTFLNFVEETGEEPAGEPQGRLERHTFGAFGGRGGSFQDSYGGFAGQEVAFSDHSSLTLDTSEDSVGPLGKLDPSLQRGKQQRSSFQRESGSFQRIPEQECLGVHDTKEDEQVAGLCNGNGGARKGSFHLQARAAINEECDGLDELMGDLPEAALFSRPQNLVECRSSSNTSIMARILHRKNLKSQDSKLLGQSTASPANADRKLQRDHERRSFQRDGLDRKSFQRDVPERTSFQLDTPARISHQDLATSRDFRDCSWSRMTYSSFDDPENYREASLQEESKALSGVGEDGNRDMPARVSHSDPSGETRFQWQTFSSDPDLDSCWMPSSVQSDALTLTQALMRSPAQDGLGGQAPKDVRASPVNPVLSAAAGPGIQTVPPRTATSQGSLQAHLQAQAQVQAAPTAHAQVQAAHAQAAQVQVIAAQAQAAQALGLLGPAASFGAQFGAATLPAPMLSAVGPLLAMPTGADGPMPHHVPIAMPPMAPLPAFSGMGWAPLPLTAAMAVLADAQRSAMLLQVAQNAAVGLQRAQGAAPAQAAPGALSVPAAAAGVPLQLGPQVAAPLSGAAPWSPQQTEDLHLAVGPAVSTAPGRNPLAGGAAGSDNRKGKAAKTRPAKTPASNSVIERVASGEVRTLMIRNIPIRYTQDMLLKEWPNDGSYDFLYLPICIDRKRNASFAFVNFVSTEAALAFQARWQKQRLEQFSSRKNLDISPADVQGRDENLLQIVRNKTFRIRNLHFQPAIFDGKDRISMEEFLTSMNWQLKGTKLCSLQQGDAKESAPAVSQENALNALAS